MKHGKRSGLIQAAVLGSIVIAAVMIIGTIYLGRSARQDTEQAVRNVSLLYLEELAGRREQVVSSALDGYIRNLDVAIGLLTKEDLSDTEHLQAYQARMKQLYGLEKFAFVDENGLIYTSRGTRTDIGEYAFDPAELSGPDISLKYGDGGNKKVIVASPVDRLPFEGKTLVACFMEIDMDRFLASLSLQSTNNGTTFCNIYTEDGKALADMVLGGLSSEKNLLDAMELAEIEDGYSLETMKKEFEEGIGGVISFSYNGIRETLSYVPVHGTDWVLTYLIRESVISDQIQTISEGIIKRSLLQSLLTALVLLIISVIMVVQTRKTIKLASERETAEMMQQELEERIALQDELLEQEKMRSEQDSMITAMAADYRSVYYVDLDNDSVVCYRKDDSRRDGIALGERVAFRKAFTEYAQSHVTEEYREAFLNFIDPESIKEGLKNEKVISLRYLAGYNGKESYEMLRMAGVRHPEDRDDHKVHAVGAGFTDIDSEMRDSLEKSQALSDALKTAEEASKAKTAFLSNMSHEIRTPMNAIIGLDSLALNEPELPERAKEYLEKIGASARHLLGLINDILDMSRIESGKLTIRNKEFSLSKMVEQINTMFSGQCREKGLEYQCHAGEDLQDYYIGDSTKLRQVLINILGNAVKFTPEGGKVVFDVRKTATFDGKSTLRFKISDTGIGMSRDFLPKLFESFSQENSMEGNKYGSSGLGMAITKSIIDMMNGELEVESEKGKGTTFTVTVTLLDAKKKVSGEGPEYEISPGDMTVLVIDDDPISCDHAKLVLEQVGITCEIALSGKEALEMIRLRHARREPYNLIIVDWQMPEMDGVETTKEIRQAIGDESVIIILTAYNWEDILEEATEAGVDSFVSKPLFSGTVMDEFKAAAKKKNVSAPKMKEKADLKGRRVLLAEDMVINAEIMLKVLEMKGIQADHAENGKIAVELFENHPEGYYDAVLMDMRMPEMDGLAATAKIREMDRADAKKIPIIALTANAFDEDVQRSLQAGLNAHLSKPVEPAVLFETLESMISPSSK